MRRRRILPSAAKRYLRDLRLWRIVASSSWAWPLVTYGHRHSGGKAERNLQGVLSSRRIHHPEFRRDRSRSHSGEAVHGNDGRTNLGRERPGRRLDLHHGASSAGLKRGCSGKTRQSVIAPGLHILRRHRRAMLRGLEQTHRAAMENYLHRNV